MTLINQLKYKLLMICSEISMYGMIENNLGNSTERIEYYTKIFDVAKKQGDKDKARQCEQQILIAHRDKEVFEKAKIEHEINIKEYAQFLEFKYWQLSRVRAMYKLVAKGKVKTIEQAINMTNDMEQ